MTSRLFVQACPTGVIAAAVQDQLPKAADSDAPSLADNSACKAEELPTGLREASLHISLPPLEPPVGGLAIEQLIRAVGADLRRDNCRAGLTSLEHRAAEMRDANDEKLRKIEECIRLAKAQEEAEGFDKVLRIVGIVFAYIVAAAMIVGGAMTGNPLLIAAGVLTLIMAINSTVSEATDGEYSIQKAVAAIAMKFGADEETANWIGFAVELAIALAALIASLAAGGVGASGTAASIFSGTMAAANGANACLTIAQGVRGMLRAEEQKSMEEKRAELKEMQALLERIRFAIEVDEAFIKAEMERIRDMMDTVVSIIRECNRAKAVVLSASPRLA